MTKRQLDKWNKRLREESEPIPDRAIAGKPGLDGFGERLRCVRRMRRKTQDELGQKLGTSGMSISHFECGRRLPCAGNLFAISNALNVSVDYLLGCDR